VVASNSSTARSRAAERSTDRDRRPVGQDRDGLHVGVVEVARRLFGEVEVAPRLTADDQRGAQERRHRRMPGGEPVGARVRAHIGQHERARIVDQHAENPATARKIADRCVRRRIHAARQKPLERTTIGSEHADRGVAGARELACGLEQPLEDNLQIELGHQQPPGLQQTTGLRLVRTGRDPGHSCAFNQCAHAEHRDSSSPARRDFAEGEEREPPGSPRNFAADGLGPLERGAAGQERSSAGRGCARSLRTTDESQPAGWSAVACAKKRQIASVASGPRGSV
jgi:hypothetical protein